MEEIPDPRFGGFNRFNGLHLDDYPNDVNDHSNDPPSSWGDLLRLANGCELKRPTRFISGFRFTLTDSPNEISRVPRGRLSKIPRFVWGSELLDGGRVL